MKVTVKSLQSENKKYAIQLLVVIAMFSAQLFVMMSSIADFMNGDADALWSAALISISLTVCTLLSYLIHRA